jgi:hypothetical protein
VSLLFRFTLRPGLTRLSSVSGYTAYSMVAGSAVAGTSKEPPVQEEDGPPELAEAAPSEPSQLVSLLWQEFYPWMMQKYDLAKKRFDTVLQDPRYRPQHQEHYKNKILKAYLDEVRGEWIRVLHEHKIPASQWMMSDEEKKEVQKGLQWNKGNMIRADVDFKGIPGPAPQPSWPAEWGGEEGHDQGKGKGKGKDGQKKKVSIHSTFAYQF